MDALNWLKSLIFESRYKKLIFLYCISIAAFDTWVQNLTVIAAGALALAILPWFIDVIKKISIPGGVELELHRVEERINDLPPPPQDAPRQEVLSDLFERDPNLALAGLRIEIEKRLRRLAEQHEIKSTNRSISSLLSELERQGIVRAPVSSIIRDMVPALNSAIHAQDVPSDTGDWVIRNGPRLLAALDEKAAG